MTLVRKQDTFFISAPCGVIEARFTAAKPEGTLAPLDLMAIVCHPHPLHGGTMDNKVVTTLVRTYRDLGVAVISFNFRGVGASDGQFDHAIGEIDDLLAVAAWVRERQPQVGLMLAGFSFGSSIAAQVSYRLERVQHLLLVAPPIERYPYDRNRRFNCPLCVVQGGEDERVVAAGVYTWASSLQSPTKLLRYEQAGHFFHGYLTQLKNDLTIELPINLVSFSS